MPVFRTTPSQSLSASVRRMVASGGPKVGALNEITADAAAARTARDLSLADKARLEVEAMQQASAARNDPALATEYAAHASGIDLPAANRLTDAIRGKLEQPSQADIDDADMAGVEAQPFPTERPVLGPGQERSFRSALASTIANRIATGKTNASQLAQAGGRIADTSMSTEAGETEDVPGANRLIAAVARKVREPYKLGAQGQVLNEETGTVNEGTKLAAAATALSGARATTEGSRQTELGARATRNTSQAGLADARKAAVERGETGRGGQRITPEQVERWVSEVARKEWDTIPAKERKGMNYQQHLTKVRDRFIKAKGTPESDPVAELEDAHDAINNGADRVAVAQRFKQRTGLDLPEDDTEEE